MPRGGSRGVALGVAAAVLLGAGAGMLLSRVSAEASTPDPAISVGLPLALTSPDGGTHVLSLRVQRPAPAEVPEPVRPSREACGAAGGRMVTWRVTIGARMPTTAGEFARAVQDVVCDERGWIGSGIRFRYAPADGDFVVSLYSAKNTERRCLNLIGLSVRHTWSCAGTHEAVLNADRWFDGSPTLDLSVRRYRQLLVNHEVGHLLGHGHRGCPGSGMRAPVMMQQSIVLGGCRPNTWPTGAEL